MARSESFQPDPFERFGRTVRICLARGFEGVGAGVGVEGGAIASAGAVLGLDFGRGGAGGL
ncbi:MAG: hypothetical protein AAFX78_05555 [Cyanobacteria bacterium J06638_20]